MAGQSVGLVDENKSFKRIIDEMIDDAKSELRRLQRIFIAEFARNWGDYDLKGRPRNWESISHFYRDLIDFHRFYSVFGHSLKLKYSEAHGRRW